MFLHVVVTSQYLAALGCSQPCFLILSCSAYLACVLSWGCNQRHAYTSPHVDGPTAVPHIRSRTHMHSHTCLYLPHNMHNPRLHWGSVVTCGTLDQVALTDLEDVVDGGGQRLACGGYL